MDDDEDYAFVKAGSLGFASVFAFVLFVSPPFLH